MLRTRNFNDDLSLLRPQSWNEHTGKVESYKRSATAMDRIKEQIEVQSAAIYSQILTLLENRQPGLETERHSARRHVARNTGNFLLYCHLLANRFVLR